MVRFWCMRFEGKYNYFKDLAHRVRCYKNIPKTLARRHQHMMSYIFGTSSISNTPFEKDSSVGVCKYLKNNTFLTFLYVYNFAATMREISSYQFKDEVCEVLSDEEHFRR